MHHFLHQILGRLKCIIVQTFCAELISILLIATRNMIYSYVISNNLLYAAICCLWSVGCTRLPKREWSNYRPNRKDKRAAKVRGSQGPVFNTDLVIWNQINQQGPKQNIAECSCKAIQNHFLCHLQRHRWINKKNWTVISQKWSRVIWQIVCNHKNLMFIVSLIYPNDKLFSFLNIKLSKMSKMKIDLIDSIVWVCHLDRDGSTKSFLFFSFLFWCLECLVLLLAKPVKRLDSIPIRQILNRVWF